MPKYYHNRVIAYNYIVQTGNNNEFASEFPSIYQNRFDLFSKLFLFLFLQNSQNPNIIYF